MHSYSPATISGSERLDALCCVGMTFLLLAFRLIHNRLFPIGLIKALHRSMDCLEREDSEIFTSGRLGDFANRMS